MIYKGYRQLATQSDMDAEKIGKYVTLLKMHRMKL